MILLLIERTRKDILQQCLTLLKRNVQDIWRRFVTVDETLVVKQWIAPGESAPKKAKIVSSAGKVMATVFWNAQGDILIDYLQDGQTITGEYYATLVSRLHEKLLTKRPKLAHRNPFSSRQRTGLHFRSFNGKSI